jgi:hypothetical protein
VPWRGLDKYWRYRGTSGSIRRLANDHNFGRSLVIINGLRWPEYASASYLNPAVLSPDYDGPIYALPRDAASFERLLAAFPDRPVVILHASPDRPGDYYLSP